MSRVLADYRNYIWQAREQGAKVGIRVAHHSVARATSSGRKAGRTLRCLPVCCRCATSAIGSTTFIGTTVGEQVAGIAEWTLKRTAEVTGVPERALMQAAEWWGPAKTSFLFHARGIEHHSNGVQNALGTINLVLATGRIGKSKSGYGTIVGQANGQGGREHGQKCDQLPGWRDISNPEHRRYIAGVWGIDEPDLPGPGVDAYELFRKIDRGEIKALLAICFNPKVSLPTTVSLRAVSTRSSSSPRSISS